MNSTALKLIIACLFGKKYYANLYYNHVTNRCEITSDLCSTKKEAEQQRAPYELTHPLCHFMETVTIRSRKVILI